MSEMKILDDINDGLDSAGQKFSALEDRAIKTIHSSRQRGKSIFKTGGSIAERWGNFMKVNLCATGVPAVVGVVGVRWDRKILQEGSKCDASIKTQTQEATQTRAQET